MRLILCLSMLLIAVHAAAQADNLSVMAAKPTTDNVIAARSADQKNGSTAASTPTAAIPPAYQLTDSYTFGIYNHPLDDFTAVIGWRLNERWFFGHQDGEDSGLTLVWQAERDQMSLSKDGIRFTRRF